MEEENNKRRALNRPGEYTDQNGGALEEENSKRRALNKPGDCMKDCTDQNGTTKIQKGSIGGI